jgi:hypothetical protein
MINDYIEQNVYREEFKKDMVKKCSELKSDNKQSWISSLWQGTVGRIKSFFGNK